MILPASQSPNAGLEVQGYLYGAMNELDLAIIELPGHSSTGLEFGNWGRVSTGDPVFAVGRSVNGASSEVAIKGSLASPHAQPSIGNPVNLETFAWPNSNGQEFQAGAPVVGLGGRIFGIVAASSTRAGSGKGQPIVVPLSSGLLDEIIDRTKNQSSVLRVAPDTPIAGREVSFTLKAEPGQIVQIGHLNPDGKKVAWVFPNGSTRSEDDEHITVENRGADESGTVSWTRPGTLDLAGRWTVRVIFDPFTETPDAVDFPYTMYDLQADDVSKRTLGIPWNIMDNGDFSVYHSEAVPIALAVDIVGKWRTTHQTLEGLWKVSVGTIPHLYLTGSEEDFEGVNRYLEIAFSYGGLYRNPGTTKLPGVIVNVQRTNSEARLNRLLSHEFAHHVFHTITNRENAKRPAWVNEGLAEWSEFSAKLEGDNTSTRLRLRAKSMDRARDGASDGKLFPLRALEDQKVWNRRVGDEKSLGYSQAYMAMLYMIERFELPIVLRFARNLDNYSSLGAAMAQELSISYDEFEADFFTWLGSTQSSDFYYEKGQSYDDSGTYREAIAEYTAAIDLDPNTLWYYTSRGWAYYRLDQLEDALRDADLALGLDRFDPSSHNLRAWALYELGDYKRAISDFSRAIELNPHAYYFRGRGMAHDQLAQHGPAIANFDAAIRIDKNYAQAYLSRGWAHFDLERYQESLLDGSRVIELEPENRWGYRMRGRSLYRMGRYEEAILDFDRALIVDPHQWVYVDRGRTNYKLSRYDQALLDFDAAIRIDPEYAHAYDWRAATHDKLGNEPEKKADRQIACSIDNTFWFC